MTESDIVKVQKRDRDGHSDSDPTVSSSSLSPASSPSPKKTSLVRTPIIKSQPNFVFASWLCSKMGQSELRTGSGVIDIAGGNGLLSFELTCRYGIPSTVIDPRQMKFNALLKRRMKKLTKNRIKSYNRIIDPSGGDEKVTDDVKWENCVIKVEDDFHVLDRVKDSVAGNDDILPFRQYQSYYEGPQSNITSSKSEDLELLSNASMFVGMHPGK